jgi:hypothetical protein
MPVHHDYLQRRALRRGLERVQRAIEIVPTVYERNDDRELRLHGTRAI